MNSPIHNLLKILSENKVSPEFLERSRELLHQQLWPEWRRMPERVDGEELPLTIGMATFDDYDGVYFSLQAIRMYHREILERVEFLIVDNQPDSPSGQAVARLADSLPQVRYVPYTARGGTAVRDLLFRYALGRFVLCMDCHVFFPPGSLSRLLDYLEEHPDCSDLLQGPLLNDTLNDCSTHLNEDWKAYFWGRWTKDERVDEAEAEAFEIRAQGLGVFCGRRAVWPGINPRTRGFCVEEGLLHEKYRRRGDRALCLPFLKWMHRFERPMGVPYRHTLESRLRNFLIQFREVELDPQPVLEHFQENMEKEALAACLREVEEEMEHPSYRFETMTFCLETCPGGEAVIEGVPLFRRAAVRRLGSGEEHPDLPLLGALRESCREAEICDLGAWCVLWAQGLSSEELGTRLRSMEAAGEGVWSGLGEFQLDAQFSLWKFDRELGQRFLESSPERVEELLEEEWLREFRPWFERTLKGSSEALGKSPDTKR